MNGVAGNRLKKLARLLGDHIDLRFEKRETPVWVKADLSALEQVIMDLCGNARDAMPRGGRLVLNLNTVETDEIYVQRFHEALVGSFACLTVSDTGCGMAAEVLKHLFEPFRARGLPPWSKPPPPRDGKGFRSFLTPWAPGRPGCEPRRR